MLTNEHLQGRCNNPSSQLYSIICLTETNVPHRSKQIDPSFNTNNQQQKLLKQQSLKKQNLWKFRTLFCDASACGKSIYYIERVLLALIQPVIKLLPPFSAEWNNPNDENSWEFHDKDTSQGGRSNIKAQAIIRLKSLTIVQVTVYDMIIWTLRPYAIAAETQLSLVMVIWLLHISINLDVHTTRFNPLWLPNLHLKFISDNSKIRLPITWDLYLLSLVIQPEVYYLRPSDFCRSFKLVHKP